MSGLPAILKATEEDIKLLLSAQSHLGTKNCDVHMEPYVWKRRADGMAFDCYKERSGLDSSPLLCTIICLQKTNESPSGREDDLFVAWTTRLYRTYQENPRIDHGQLKVLGTNNSS
jgi:hypothetical protein